MTQLNREQLIEMLEAAASKDELEALGQKHLETDVDKRRGLESIRADLIEAAEELPESEGDDERDSDAGDTETHPDGQVDGANIDASVVDTLKAATPEPQSQTANDAGDAVERMLATGGPVPEHVPATAELSRKPKIDPATNGAEKPGNRTLVNMQNGRRLVWTAALAQLPHMREE
ncbi:hypothetical protein [Salinicola halophilus]|uniref:hypothetical protein n=1 Tax=Salinicola halophilus TaxID=184065 RepID=UPI000DA123DD|nr:hypothetical protein [Salinicola halophilus]